LLLTPTGRDARVISQLLERNAIVSLACDDTSALTAEIEKEAGCAILSEEALRAGEWERLHHWLRQQPPWTHYPINELGSAGTKGRHPAAIERLDLFGNVILLERPLHAEGLLRAVSSALSARGRQYEARHRLQRLADAQAELERQVEQRTADLAKTVQSLHEEIEERKRAEEALRQSQKLEAVGQLTGGVAHDFNNLLTIIRSAVDFLRRPDLPDARRVRYIAAISDTVDRAAKLTGQLLAFARRQPLKAEVFEVGSRLGSVVDLVRPVVGGRIAVEVESEPGSFFVEADVSQFETALINLSVNARDAMDGEGVLKFKLFATDKVPATRGHAEAEGSFVAIGVTDSGQGIEPLHIDKIFEPFFTTKQLGQGTGLGLSQVFGFAKQSGGEITVASKLGQGATFTLYLSRVSAPPVSLEPPPIPNHSAGGPSLSVLVVEDNEAIGRFATEMLEDLGFLTRWVSNGDAALEQLAGKESTFDVVFSDVMLPGMNGIELARLIRTKYPHVPVVLTSGYSSVLAEEGHCGFELLKKPYSVDALGRTLRAAAARTARPVGSN
jgi:signal transduction histidine kinase/ActR/RegA family two-component response regulator